MVLAEIYDYLIWFFAQVQLFLHIFALRTARFIKQRLVIGTLPARVRESPYRRTVLLIGDGLAEGVGDSLVHGGPGPRLEKLLRESKRDGGLKMNWTVISLGRLHANSKDWAIGRDGPGLFERVFITGMWRSADIVVIICGGGEDLDDKEETVSRIRGVAEALLRMNKQVLVASIPYCDDENPEKRKEAAERNLMLKAAIESIDAGKDCQGRATFAVDVQTIFARGADVLNIENNFVTLNSAGYRSLAGLLFDAVLNPAKRVEWGFWRTKLNLTSSRPRDQSS